jgi:hypothetical protein
MRQLFLFFLLLSACIKPPLPPPPPQTGLYQKGIFVVNEGIFGQTSGTITFVDSLGQVYQDVYQSVNGRELGNVVQSMSHHRDRFYVVVNNSNRLAVLSDSNLVELQRIEGLALPRYFLALNDTLAYVSEWGSDGLSGSLALLHLPSGQVQRRIPLYKGPEQMLRHGERVLVAQVGGYDNDNKIAVIENHQLQATWTVGDNPNGLALDAQDQLWVLCGGKTVYTIYPQVDLQQSSSPQLRCLHPQTGQTLWQVDFEKGFPAKCLSCSPSHCYWNRRDTLWEINCQTKAIRPLASGNYYGLGYRQERLYAARYQGIEQAWVRVFDLQGQVRDSFQAGVFANGFLFLP